MPTQVVNAAGNVLWTSDKVEISAVTDVTFQVGVTTLGNTANITGNLYANAVSVPAGTSTQAYVGVGNRLYLTGNTFTAVALGTESSAQASIYTGPSYGAA